VGARYQRARRDQGDECSTGDLSTFLKWRSRDFVHCDKLTRSTGNPATPHAELRDTSKCQRHRLRNCRCTWLTEDGTDECGRPERDTYNSTWGQLKEPQSKRFGRVYSILVTRTCYEHHQYHSVIIMAHVEESLQLPRDFEGTVNTT
jgi:hypothetical protein